MKAQFLDQGEHWPATQTLGQRVQRAARVVGKAIIFLVLTLGSAVVLMCGMLCLAFSVSGQRYWRGLLFRFWAKALIRLLGLQLKVSGPLPATPFLLVANHLSYVDVIVLAAQFDCVFVAKSEIAAWPLLGWLSRQLNTIFIERQRKRDVLRVNTLLTAALAAGQNVVLFPEGTTSAGETVLPFKSSLLEPAVHAGCGVSYASLSYRTAVTDTPAAEAVCWWGEMEFVPHLLKLFALSGFDGELVFGAAPIAAPDRKVLARRLHAAIEDDLATAHSRPSAAPMQLVKHSTLLHTVSTEFFYPHSTPEKETA